MRLGRFFLLILFCASGAFAQDLSGLFKTHYEKHYDPRKCGENILAFARAVSNAQGPIDSLHIVEIGNKGFHMFGMVNAERARGQRFKRPSEEETNWYHHFIVLDDQGRVYDFSYGIQPSIPPIEEYLERMYLDEEECRNPRAPGFCIGRDQKLDDYRFEATPAASVVDGNPAKPKQATMRQVLENWRVLLP